MQPHQPPQELSIKTIAAFMVMVFGMFMAILDIQIVSSSLAEIQAGLSASSDEISWVQTSYLIAEVIMIPLSGFLNRALSTRVLFTTSAIGFTIASVLCATATSMPQMMIYRALQGFIGGGMIPTVFASAFTIFPPAKRNLVSPIIGLVVTLAPTIGPTVGGYLSDSFSWHWLFLINLPMGILVSLGAWYLIDFDEGDKSLFETMDWIGLISMAVFLGSLEYVLEEGPQHDWFSDTAVLSLAIAMILGGIIFFYRSFTNKNAIVDLYAFANLNFALGSFFSFVMGIGLYGMTYLYPLYLSSIQHYSSYMIGNTMFISGLSMFIGAPIAAILSNKLDPRILMALGFLGFAGSTYQTTYLTSDWAFSQLFLPQLFRGISMMMCMVPINNIALGTLPAHLMKNASGLYNLTRNLGGAIGLGLLNTILINRSAFHYERLAETINWGNKTAEGFLQNLAITFNSSGLNGKVLALAQLAGIVKSQAMVMAFVDCFVILTSLFCLLCLLVWLVKKPENKASGAH